MKDVINKIKLDLAKDKIRTSVSMRRGDTLSRAFHITLLNSGQVYEIPDGAIAALVATKPDGKTVYGDCVISGNEIIYHVSNQMVTTVGDVECQIELAGSDGALLPSPVFILRVYDKLLNEEVLESSNEYKALQSYCARAEEAATAAAENAKTAKESLKELLQQGQSGGSSSGGTTITATVEDETLIFGG